MKIGDFVEWDPSLFDATHYTYGLVVEIDNEERTEDNAIVYCLTDKGNIVPMYIKFWKVKFASR